MEIRPLRETEVPTFVDDLWKSFAREMAALDPYNRLAEDIREGALDYRREQLQNDEVAVFVADTGAELVGHSVVARREAAPVFARGIYASLEEVYVVPDHRGAGVATDLMDCAEAWARNRDCERVELSVNAKNEAAQGLYEQRGYSVRCHKMDRSL